MFNKAYVTTMKHEGLYSNDPDDPGGETYRGISRVHHPEWEGWRYIDGGGPGLYMLTGMAMDFYYKEYWKKTKCHWFDDAVGEELFEAGVNIGRGIAAGFLQEGLNLLNRNEHFYDDLYVDGKIGPQTKRAYEAMPKKYLTHLVKIQNIFQGWRYISLMVANPKKEKWVGWFGRVSL